MKKTTLITGILFFTTFVCSKFCPEKKDEWWKSLCSTIKYSNTVEDKPELLILQYFPLPPFIDGTYFSYAYTNCLIHSNQSESSLFDLSEYLPNSLVYDSRRGTYYRETRVGDGFEIIHHNGKIESTYYKRDSFDDDYQIHDLALDWVTRNLYLYTEKYVAVVKLSDKTKKFKKLFAHDGTYQGKIVLAPNDGYMFLLYKPNLIVRRNMDGTNPIKIRVHSEPDLHISFMTLDPYTKKLYYSVFYSNGPEVENNSIHYMNLNGGHDEKFVISENIFQRQITVDKNYIYYPLRGDYSTVARINKNNGIRDWNFNITNYNHTVNSYAINLINLGLPQEIKKDHPCKSDNGGCPHICIAIPGKAGELLKVCK